MSKKITKEEKEKAEDVVEDIQYIQTVQNSTFNVGYKGNRFELKSPLLPLSDLVAFLRDFADKVEEEIKKNTPKE